MIPMSRTKQPEKIKILTTMVLEISIFYFQSGHQTYRTPMGAGAGAAEEAQICSLCSFGEHGQTVRGIDLNPIAYDQKRYLTSRRLKNLIKKRKKNFCTQRFTKPWTWIGTDQGLQHIFSFQSGHQTLRMAMAQEEGEVVRLSSLLAHLVSTAKRKEAST